MRYRLTNLRESLDLKGNSWLITVILLSLGVRGFSLFTTEIPEEVTRRQLVAVSVATHRAYVFCNSYFPFCGPENNATASVGPVPILIFAGFKIFIDDLNLYPFRVIKGLLGINNLFIAPIVLLQLLLGLVTTVLVYKIILTLFDDRRSATLGALIWGTYLPMIIMMELSLEAEPIFTFLLALGFFLILKGLSTGRTTYWITTGVCFGLAALTRTSFLFYPLALLLLIGVYPAASARNRLRHAGWMALAFLLILSPWVIRNGLVFHAFIPGGTLNGYNLYRHNHILAEDNYLRYVYNKEMRATLEHLVETRADLQGDENEYEMDLIYRQEALKVIKAHPYRYLHLSLYRFLPLWTNYGVLDGSFSKNMWTLLGLENLLLLVLAVATAVRRRSSHLLPMLVFLALIGYFSLGHMLVNARMRFIVPVMPFVIVLAADQLIYWATKLLSRWKPVRMGIPAHSFRQD